LFFERTLVNTYLDLVHQGKNDWWRYVLAVLLILCMWQILGALPSVFLLVWTMINYNFPANVGVGDLPGTDPVVSFAVLMLASVFFVLGVYLAVRFIHRRPFRTLVTPAKSIAWGRLFQGFGVWFVLAGMMSVLEAVLFPGRYVWTPDLKHFIPFVFLALILVPIQTSAEEFFFRGYILQGVGLHVRNIWALSVISGVLFMVPHFLNPEASVNYTLMGLYYFSMGTFLAYITLRDGRLELALGVHAANNLFSALFANYTVTVMPSPSLFTVTVLDAVYSVPAALIGMVIFALLFIGPLRPKSAAENPGN
jgi:membrane protease YdiL (CAAX protease family)